MAEPTDPPGRSGAVTVLRPGDRGEGVRDVRDRLHQLGLLPDAESANGARDPRAEVYDDDVGGAVRAFQQQRGLTCDGVVGPATYRALDEARWRLGDRVLVHLPGRLQQGDDVIALQRRLLDLGFKVGRVDGRFGPRTERAVREFQRNIGVPPDGTCGPATLKALGRLAPIVRGGRPNALRAEERIRRAGPQLTGKVVVLDAAGSDVADPRLREAADEVSLDLARRVEGRLVATGVQAYLTRGSVVEGDEAQRAEFANRTDAHLCVSLHVDASEDREASGVATYYFGIEAHDLRSSVGERFAGLVQREIVARTDLADLGTHPRSWELLRGTRMPAVRVEVGRPAGGVGEEAAHRLADPSFRDAVAEGIVVAVQRLYLDPDDDPRTGVLRVEEIRRLRHAPRESPR
jgi:N-acetylmuramoyl-L-alanine amidase